MKRNIKRATIENIEKLQAICIKAYSENFAIHWNSNGLELYLESQFNYERLKSELTGDSIKYYFINYENDTVGFIKLNTSKNDVVELEKIYLLPKYKRKGLGKFAFSSIIENQKEKDLKTILLDMVDTNISSIQFH
ncbi:MAG: GNAT family N-acetyltransferase [Algibacter sp.]